MNVELSQVSRFSFIKPELGAFIGRSQSAMMALMKAIEEAELSGLDNLRDKAKKRAMIVASFPRPRPGMTWECRIRPTLSQT